MTLFQFKPTGTSSVSYVNSLVMPQAASGANLPFAGEYGSSSEGYVQLSGAGQYLTFMGYGINAATFDANPATYLYGITDTLSATTNPGPRSRSLQQSRWIRTSRACRWRHTNSLRASTRLL